MLWWSLCIYFFRHLNVSKYDSLIWNQNEISILFNDQVFFIKQIDNSMPYRFPQYILFNIAMGGNLGGTIPANFSQATMEVDYIRVYQ